jgi:hypothetical protein
MTGPCLALRTAYNSLGNLSASLHPGKILTNSHTYDLKGQYRELFFYHIMLQDIG